MNDQQYLENTHRAARVANLAMETLMTRLAVAQRLESHDVHSVVCAATIKLLAVSVATASDCCKAHALHNIAQSMTALTEALAVLMGQKHQMSDFELHEAMTAGIDQAKEFAP